MKTKNIYLTGLLTIGLASCSVEAPFKSGKETGEGQFLKSALSLDVKSDTNIKVKSGDNSDYDINDFDIIFTKVGESGSYRTYSYKDMPDVVTLPGGSYTITATFGNGETDAAWANPHFKGQTAEFKIEVDKINTDIDPIVCTLQNVMVSVVFDPDLLEHMDDEPEVEVYVNKEQSLKYNKTHSDNLTAGYFKHYQNLTTLTAEFTGTVDGVKLTETKTLDGIQPGNHYRMTFKRHSFNGEDHGDAELAVVVDANVTVNPVGEDYETGDEEFMTDITFPTETPAEDPNPGDDEPGDDEPGEENGLQVYLDYSRTDSNIVLGADKESQINDTSKIVLIIESKTGLKEFSVDITIENFGEIPNVPNNHLDLINPLDSYITFLRGVKLLGDEETSLQGKKYSEFDISEFMPLLTPYEGKHTFIVKVSDESGKIVETLNLVVK